MASSATTTLKIEKLEPGVATSWGDEINVNWDIADAAIAGQQSVSLNGADATLANSDYTLDAAKYGTLYTSDADDNGRAIIIPNAARTYRIVNSSGTYNCLVKTSGGSALTITANSSAVVRCDGSDVCTFVTPLTNATTGAPNTSSGAAASSVSVTPSGDLTSTDVQAALSELQGDIDTIEADLTANYQPKDADLTAIAALSSTKGNLQVGGASGWSALGVGTNGFALIADSGSTAGMKWAALIPAGTASIFYQASAPTGWTAVALNDYGLRVVSAGGTGGSTNGTTGYGDVFAARTIETENLPSHSHTGASLTISGGTHDHTQLKFAGQFSVSVGGGTAGFWQGSSTQDTSGTGAHSHTVGGSTGLTGSGTAMDFDVLTADVIGCTKDSY